MPLLADLPLSAAKTASDAPQALDRFASGMTKAPTLDFLVPGAPICRAVAQRSKA